MTTTTGSALLPAPTTMGWAMFAARPPTPVLRDLGLTEAEVQPVAELEEAEQQMQEAVSDLARSRPGGDRWVAAEQADVSAVKAGRPAGAVAKLLGTDAQRWGQTVAITNLVSHLAERFAAKDGTGVEVKRAAAHCAKARSMDLSRQIEEIVVPAWPKRADKAAAWTARNQADALCEQLAKVSAILGWATGHNYEPGQHKRVNPSGKAGGYAVALRNYLDGTRLLTLNPRHEYPPDLDAEPREPRTGAMLLGNRLLPPQTADRPVKSR